MIENFFRSVFNNYTIDLFTACVIEKTLNIHPPFVVPVAVLILIN